MDMSPAPRTGGHILDTVESGFGDCWRLCLVIRPCNFGVFGGRVGVPPSLPKCWSGSRFQFAHSGLGISETIRARIALSQSVGFAQAATKSADQMPRSNCVFSGCAPPLTLHFRIRIRIRIRIRVFSCSILRQMVPLQVFRCSATVRYVAK